MDKNELTILGLIHDESKATREMVSELRRDVSDLRQDYHKTQTRVAIMEALTKESKANSKSAGLWGKSSLVAAVVSIIRGFYHS